MPKPDELLQKAHVSTLGPSNLRNVGLRKRAYLSPAQAIELVPSLRPCGTACAMRNHHVCKRKHEHFVQAKVDMVGILEHQSLPKLASMIWPTICGMSFPVTSSLSTGANKLRIAVEHAWRPSLYTNESPGCLSLSQLLLRFWHLLLHCFQCQYHGIKVRASRWGATTHLRPAVFVLLCPFVDRQFHVKRPARAPKEHQTRVGTLITTSNLT
jgi:hypothetical protein